MWKEDGASCLASDMKGVLASGSQFDCIWHMMQNQRIQERSDFQSDKMQELDIIWSSI